MPPSEQDVALLWDMLAAARLLREFVAGQSLDSYLKSQLLQAAVERKVEIIGEAARKVSKDFRDSHPEIEWHKIMGQRHVLAHDYGKIQHDRLWDVASIHIPTLIAALEKLIPSSAD